MASHDILRLLTYHREDYDDAVISIHNEQNQNISHCPILSASESVGNDQLDRLPNEMLCANCDSQTCLPSQPYAALADELKQSWKVSSPTSSS